MEVINMLKEKTNSSKLQTELGKEAFGLLHRHGGVILKERCDCSHKIRHNNGGNYHARLKLVRGKEGRYYIMHDDTCRLDTDWQFWKKVSCQEVIKEINEFISRYDCIGRVKVPGECVINSWKENV